MERTSLDVLLVSEDKQDCWHLVRQFERRGWRCWFATTTEEVKVLFDARSFRLVLSTRPVTQAHPLMALLRGSDCSLFFSYPIEDSCLWIQPIRDGQESFQTPALRPSEFMSLLDRLGATPAYQHG